MFPVIKNYTIIREIGAGGMAVVYEAVDNRLQRTVAIKVLHPHLSREPSITERFIREARAAAKIDHPHIVRLFDYGSESDLHYFIMEYVPGTTLERVLKVQGTVSPENGIAIMGEIAEALAQAHSLGIIHRDVKPANILLNRQGRAMLSDFGLAHHLPDPRLTTDDAVAGTPSFMSPEQISGKPISTATDIYSWGVCLYAAVAGKLPYATETFPEVLSEIRRGKVRLDDEVLDRLPSRLHGTLRRCLTADPKQRIGDANELLVQLALSVKKQPWSIDPATLRIASVNAGSSTQASSSTITAILPERKFHRKYVIIGVAAVLATAAAGTIFLTTPRRALRQSPDGKAVFLNEKVSPHAIAYRDTGAMESNRVERFPYATSRTVKQADGSVTKFDSVPMAGGRRHESTHPISQSHSEASADFRPPSAKKEAHPAASSPVLTSPDSGALFIHCSPWAAVTVGGAVVGTTPLEKPLALPAGRHVVTLKNSFCEPLVDTVEIVAGEVLRKRYSLKVVRQ